MPCRQKRHFIHAGLDSSKDLFHGLRMINKAAPHRIIKECRPLMLLAAFFLISVFAAPNRVDAHPHVFVDCSLTFEFDESGLKGIRQKWWFDKMFAAMILGDYDKDRNNIISEEEAKEIESGAFINLRNFNYFTSISVDGNRVSSITATEFKPLVEDSTLVYTFFVPLHLAADSAHTVKVAVYDESFYTAIQMDPQNKISSTPSNMQVNLTLEQEPEMAYFYGQMVPDAAVLTIVAR
ncbi:DUF1007 family protein [Maridesulfovibrio sp.]|uniref:DUF1007 family protein n=1 Tax=Maridesulfovibrio sp. TaxID=2795000 RepID=UPI002A186DFC|nr:DUF1007 family protein [Maridesulfovibrio sp.]